MRINKIRHGCMDLLVSGTFRCDEDSHHRIADACEKLGSLEAILEKEGDDLELCQRIEGLFVSS